ncbi:MAG: sensor histidine kinase [Eubacterium sp.]|nr:sensor histidine kinase [Eubacterium sp.]
MEHQETYIIKSFIREHIKIYILYILIIVILLGAAKLYYYEDAVYNMAYAAGVITFLIVVCEICYFSRYRKRCLMLINARLKRGERSFYLPDDRSYPEKLYKDMIAMIEEEERELATECDEMKQDVSDYYTMWAHQIKTPIAALRLLLKDNMQALEELCRVEQYTDMALHYARLDSLSSDLSLRQQDIYEMIKTALKKNSVFFIGSGRFCQLEEFSIHAVTDEKWVSFVIEQVISNALKYTAKGGIHIYGLDSGEEKTHGEASYVVVEDTGIGIRQEDLPRIFERGFTGYNGRMDKRATGIGLYLCKQIMDRLSHTICVDSQVGEGTKVTLGFVQKVTKL